jgi:hypothetical protein
LSLARYAASGARYAASGVWLDSGDILQKETGCRKPDIAYKLPI